MDIRLKPIRIPCATRALEAIEEKGEALCLTAAADPPQAEEREQSVRKLLQ